MRTIETVVYKFDELSDEAKEKAIENLWDINVDIFDWWDSIHEDAENIGLKITAFDLGRASYVKGDFYGPALDVAKRIIEEHGEQCGTYQTAKDYIAEYNRLIVEQCQGEADLLAWPGYERDWDTISEYYPEELDTEDIDNEFLRSLCEDYRIILQKEYEYLTSKEAIIETIEANEYEFTEEGELI